MIIDEPRDNRDTQRLKGFSDHYLLAPISTGGVYGFELVRAMKTSQLTPNCSEGAIYGLLKRLESSALVASHEEVGQTKSRRRYYWILPEGEKRLPERNEQWSRSREGMDSMIGNYLNYPNYSERPDVRDLRELREVRDLRGRARVGRRTL